MWRLVMFGTLVALSVTAQAPNPEWRTGVWRGHLIEYQEFDGWAMVHGDILLARLEEIDPPHLAGAASKEDPQRSASILPMPDRRWPDGVVYYTLDRGLRNPERVRTAMRHWEERTPIRFVERSGEPNYVVVRSVDSGCSATIGMAGGQQFVNLADGCGLGTTIHEFGHTIGMWHTQSRSDRDRRIRVRYENIDRAYWGQYDMQLVNGENSGPYDYGSIMHYSERGFARAPGPTMQSRPLGIPLGAGSAITAGDIAAAHVLAGGKAPEVMVTSTPPGLKIVVDGQEYTTPVSFPWREGERHRLTAPVTQPGNSMLAGFEFAGWGHASEPETEIHVADERVYHAYYRQLVRLTIPPLQNGRVEISPASPDGTYPAGTTIRVRAVPDPGYAFHRWRDNFRDGFPLAGQFLGWSANPMTFFIHQSMELSALFTDRPLTTIDSNVPGIGITVDNIRTFPPASFDWEPGSTHTIVAPMATNLFSTSSRHIFLDWSNGQPARQTFTAGTESVRLTARFRSQVSISARLDTPGAPGNIRLTPQSPDGWYDRGLRLLVQGLDTTNSPFLHWAGDLGGTQNPVEYVIEDAPLFVAVNQPALGILGASFVHAATQQAGPVSPGQNFMVYRLNPEISGVIDAPYWEPTELPATLGGFRVLFDEISAPLLSVDSRSIRGVVPEAIAGRSRVVIRVLKEGILAGQTQVAVLESTPGIYSRAGSGSGDGMVWNEDWVENTPDTPAPAGQQIHFLATGLGLTDPPEQASLRTGQVRPVCLLEAEFGTDPAEIVNLESYRDLPPGVFRIWVRVPGGLPSGRHSLTVTCDGRPSRPGVWVHTE